MPDHITLQHDREGIKEREDGQRSGGGDYSREAIILNISVKGGDYLREAINRGTAIFRGNTVFLVYVVMLYMNNSCIYARCEDCAFSASFVRERTDVSL